MTSYPFSMNYRSLIRISMGILCLISFIILSGCGGESVETSKDTGFVSFQVEWDTAGTAAEDDNDAVPVQLDCEAVGVSTVKGTVYNRYDELLAESPQWDCGDHAGTILGVRKGRERRLVIFGKDKHRDLLYRGELSEIEVEENKVTEVGLIVAHYFIPTNGFYNDSTNVLTWLPVLKAMAYEVQIAEVNTFTYIVKSMTVYDTSSGTLFGSGLNSGTTYYWRIRARDKYDNQSAWSETWDFVY